MKRYTGNLTIELEDVNTGTVETVSETNMVTNAVNDLLGVNPMGVMYKAGGQYDDSLTWNDELLPICPNMIGGILRRQDRALEYSARLDQLSRPIRSPETLKLISCHGVLINCIRQP